MCSVFHSCFDQRKIFLSSVCVSEQRMRNESQTVKKKPENPIPQSFIALNPAWKRLLCGLFCIQIRCTVEKLKQNHVKSYRKAVL